LPTGLPYPTAATASQLIADINYVNTTGGAITVNLAPGTTLDLKSANNTTDGGNGLPVIGGTKAVALTITGNGDTIERIAVYTKRGGSNPFRLFDVSAGSSLTLDHVNAKNFTGGAIFNRGTLKVTNGSVLTGNATGIVNYGTATVSNSTVSNGGASLGGGVVNNGTLTISNSILSGNTATYGGAIYNAGTVTLSSSTLSGNSATYGGGVYNAGGTLTVSNNCALTGNYVSPDYNGRGGLGGAIYNGGGKVVINHSVISGNTAYLFGLYGIGGGGIYNDARGTVTVKNYSRITGNSSGFDESIANEDVHNLGVVYRDNTSTIGVLDGNPAILI
jgi:predicted outer membrane repeat protein